MRDKILEVLKLARNNALNVKEISEKISSIQGEIYNITDVSQEILKLQEEKLVYCVNSEKKLYTLNPFKEGIFRVKRNGNCFVLCSGEMINISSDKTYGCLEGDKVLVRVTDFDRMEGSIKEIIERRGLIGEVKTIKNKRYASIGDTLYAVDLDESIVDGMLIGIKVDKKKTGKYYRATLDKIIGHKNAPKLDEKKILYEFGISDEFSDATIEELKHIPTEVEKEDMVGRKDYRNEVIFTIDGDDTKDIDDAVSLDILANGNYYLGVHIADVSNYVKEGSSIDLDARERGTSVYMPGVVCPMYSPQLSNGICSLNPGVDRLAISCCMEIDHQGKVINYDINKSIIHSKLQMTYKKVNKILDENIIPEGYEPYADKLKKMQELALILRKMRSKRGLLNFDAPEVKIEVDSAGKVLNICLRNQGTGENLIEDFMLMANECVATYIYNMGLNSIYRVHDYPNEEKLKQTVSIIKSYGENISTKISIKDPHVIQNILDSLKDSEKFSIYSNMILRCMSKAVYKNINEGHFGVGIDCKRNEAYTHFTSPIRRYPDTTIHRILTYVLSGNADKIQNESYKANLIDIANHSSAMEQVADRCEREADKMKMADYMSNFIGKEYQGRITGFTLHGMFVQLDNYVEGRIGYNTMDDFYVYNEDMEMLVGERKKKVYRLGDKIDVKLVKSDKESRELDFELVKKVIKKHKLGWKNGNSKQKSAL